MTPSPDIARRALFLDRDGVINVDHGYVATRERCDFIPGIFALCRAAVHLDYVLVIITNQAGIGRGYYSEQEFHTFMDWMGERFASEGAALAGVYFCPYHPEHGIGEYRREAECRKPAPGMILQAAKELTIDLPNSRLIGDKMKDIEAGRAAGIGTKLLFTTGVPEAHGDFEIIEALENARPFLGHPING